MMQVTQGSPSLGRSPTFGPSQSAIVGGPDIIPSTTTTTTHHVEPTTPSAVKSEESSNPAEGGEPSSKPKQKRNKPTLSCLECVERKTKCDRARPCLACVKRQSPCEYTAVCVCSHCLQLPSPLTFPTGGKPHSFSRSQQRDQKQAQGHGAPKQDQEDQYVLWRRLSDACGQRLGYD